MVFFQLALPWMYCDSAPIDMLHNFFQSSPASASTQNERWPYNEHDCTIGVLLVVHCGVRLYWAAFFYFTLKKESFVPQSRFFTDTQYYKI